MEEKSEPDKQEAPDKRRRAKKILIILLIILLIVAAFGAGWWWRDRDAKKLDQYRQDQISGLRERNAKLKKRLAVAKKKASSSSSSTIACSEPSANELSTIKDAVTSMNTAALEGYMKPSVNVILPATEAYGPQTPVQAINDLSNELKGANNPWDFNIGASILSSYGKGSYGQYFPNDALVGKSANNYVVSFQFDCGKISGIFIAADENLLQ